MKKFNSCTSQIKLLLAFVAILYILQMDVKEGHKQDPGSDLQKGHGSLIREAGNRDSFDVQNDKHKESKGSGHGYAKMHKVHNAFYGESD